MAPQNDPDLPASYDRVAGEYATRLFGELAHKPLDCALLDQLAERTRGGGPVCDLGCGPGQVARYLHERGVEVCGVDLSAGQVAEARRLNPDIPFEQGDMRALPVADGAWAGIAAFYSLIHIPRHQMGETLRELRRVLQPGGWLLVAFHIGQETVHLDEWWGETVSLDFHFFHPDEMEGFLQAAGFELHDRVERPPYPEVEFPSQRAYLFARKPLPPAQT